MALQTNSDTLITIFGGSGFLGRHVVRALAKRRYRIRVAVRRPELAGFLQPLGSVGQIHAVQANLRYPRSVEAAVRDASVVDQSGRHPVRARTPALRCGPAFRRRAGRARGIGLRRARDPCLRDRRRRECAIAICAIQGEGRTGGARGLAGGHDRSSVDRVRAGRRVLQSLRRDGAHAAGAAAGRRRADQVPAGLCRRRRRSDRRSRRDRARGSRKTYEFGGPEVRTFREIDGIRAGHHRAFAPAGAGAVRARQAAGLFPAIPAEPAA